MDFSGHYCSRRRDLEENGWFLTTRLSNLTGQLMRLIGQDQEAFLVKKAECRDTRNQIQESHRRLRAHRSRHGC